MDLSGVSFFSFRAVLLQIRSRLWMRLRRPVDQRQQRRITQFAPSGREHPKASDNHVIEGDERLPGDRSIPLGHLHLPHAPLFPLGIGNVATRPLPLNGHCVTHRLADDWMITLNIYGYLNCLWPLRVSSPGAAVARLTANCEPPLLKLSRWCLH